jgi:hypothetical protein
MVPAPGLLHIGGTAYFVWAYPPIFGCTAQRHVQVRRRTTVTSRTVANAMIETLRRRIEEPSKNFLTTHQLDID